MGRPRFRGRLVRAGPVLMAVGAGVLALSAAGDSYVADVLPGG